MIDTCLDTYVHTRTHTQGLIAEPVFSFYLGDNAPGELTIGACAGLVMPCINDLDGMNRA